MSWTLAVVFLAFLVLHPVPRVYPDAYTRVFSKSDSNTTHIKPWLLKHIVWHHCFLMRDLDKDTSFSHFRGCIRLRWVPPDETTGVFLNFDLQLHLWNKDFWTIHCTELHSFAETFENTWFFNTFEVASGFTGFPQWKNMSFLNSDLQQHVYNHDFWETHRTGSLLFDEHSNTQFTFQHFWTTMRL